MASLTDEIDLYTIFLPECGLLEYAIFHSMQWWPASGCEDCASMVLSTNGLKRQGRG